MSTWPRVESNLLFSLSIFFFLNPAHPLSTADQNRAGKIHLFVHAIVIFAKKVKGT